MDAKLKLIDAFMQLECIYADLNSNVTLSQQHAFCAMFQKMIDKSNIDFDFNINFMIWLKFGDTILLKSLLREILDIDNNLANFNTFCYFDSISTIKNK